MARKSLGVAASGATDVLTRAEVQALIAAAGGGGGGSRPAIPRPGIGHWMLQGGRDSASLNPVNGTLYLGSIFLPAGTYDAAAFHVTSAGSAGATAKVIVYDDADNALGSVLVDATGVAATTTGQIQVTGLNLVAPSQGRMVWAGVVTQGAPSTVPTYFRISNTSTALVFTGTPNITYFPSPSLSFLATGITGAAPSSPTYTQSLDGHIRMAFRRSA